MTVSLYETEKDTPAHGEDRQPCEEGGRDWRVFATSHQKLEKTRRVLPQSLLRDCGPTNTLILDLQPLGL